MLTFITLAVLCCALTHARMIVDNADYTIYRTPDDVTGDASGMRTVGGLSLNGGGRDVDAAFAQMIRNANGGDFLVLRASGADGYNDYLHDMSLSMNTPLHSVTSIVCKNRNASSAAEVLQYVHGAEAIFFAGGDQSRYVEFFRDSPLQRAVQSRVDSDVSVGGTSAGLAILGTRIYSAKRDTVYSDEAMENPYNKYMAFSPALFKFPAFDNIITDTHFSARNRMGRALTFAARSQSDLRNPQYRVLGVDQEAALFLDRSTGRATMLGKYFAFVCGAENVPSSCVNALPLQWKNITCHRLSAEKSDWYDFAARTGSGVDYSLQIEDGVIVGEPYGP